MIKTCKFRRIEKGGLSGYDRIVSLTAIKSLSDNDRLESGGVGDSEGSCAYI